MTHEEAKQLCIEAHKGQWRRPRPINFEHTKLPMNYKHQFVGNSDDGLVNIDGNLITYEHDTIMIAEPYSTHPIAVAEMMDTDEEKIVAYLHDVIEDCNYTFHRFVDQYMIGLKPSKPHLFVVEDALPLTYDIARAIDLLTKQKGMSYNDFIKRLVDSGSKLALKVKIADMFHNMSGNPTPKQKQKYLNGIKILLKAL